MKLLRVILVLAVIAYAGWLAWPVVSPFLEGAAPDSAAMRAGAEADVGGGLPVGLLWIGAAFLYLVSALMLGAGNPKAVIAYVLGFLADATLRLALDSTGGGEIAARSAEALGPVQTASGLSVDPTWLVLAALAVVGGLVALAARRRRRTRAPGQLAI